MKYKVNDRVKIKSIDWYNKNKNEDGIIGCGSANFIPDMKIYCGDILTICDIDEELSYYYMTGCQYTFKEEMIEGLCLNDDTDHITETVVDYVKESNDRYRIVIDPRFDIEVDEGEYYAVRRKKEYPKTYCECKDILGLWDIDDTECGYYKTDLIDKLQMLLICRDAYWKIAGEEMGLGKPWEPDWSDTSIKYCLERDFDAIDKNVSNHKGRTFAFPTEEMRDAFYENFKEEIEICKELL